MYKIKIATVGKAKESWLQDGLEEYTARLKPFAIIEWILAKNGEKLKQFLKEEASYICLDPKGKLYSSEQFSRFLIDQLQEQGSRLTLVIGDAEGLDPETRQGAAALLSLSPMTFTHQMTRLILLEQLYRAIEIDRGTAYHK
ncbi:MAG: 23S rRNA (pseudouridine(1915)-N(3))-methyltransferase RlmH [Verrucomicrobia bacterium]|nr:23S rRNA (pseudouridine(1915)-N(3))-methyltransferase RlmH [Verrucomicrobiota bacterium]